MPANKTPLVNQVALTAAAVGGADELAVVCLTQNDMNSTTNNITVDTFCGTENAPGTLGQTLAVAFRRIWSPDVDEISEQFFYNAWKDGTHLQFTIGPITPAPGDISYKGTGYVTAYNNTNGANTFPAASMTVTADEPFELTKEP